MINLEEKLIEQKAKSNQDLDKILLHFQDIIDNAEDEDLQLLSTVGFDTNMYQDLIKRRNLNTQNLKSDRIFHKDEIKEICLNYDLRFLKTKHYKGALDAQIPIKIRQLESDLGEKAINSFFIVAPKSSFKLEEKPKDPLLFYQLNNEYYFLVHKWGNDLSAFNRIKGFFKRYASKIKFFGVLPALLMGIISYNSTLYGVKVYYFILCLLFFVVPVVTSFMFDDLTKDYYRNWDSNYKSEV